MDLYWKMTIYGGSQIIQYMNPLFECVPSLNPPGLIVSEKMWQKFLMFENWKERKMEKLEAPRAKDRSPGTTSPKAILDSLSEPI